VVICKVWRLAMALKLLAVPSDVYKWSINPFTNLYSFHSHKHIHDNKIIVWKLRYSRRNLPLMGCLWTLSVQRLCAVGQQVNEWLNGKDLEGSGHSLIEVVSQYMSRGIEKSHEKSQSEYTVPRPKFEQRTSLIQVLSVRSRLSCSA
jgi:hypothetical protein